MVPGITPSQLWSLSMGRTYSETDIAQAHSYAFLAAQMLLRESDCISLKVAGRLDTVATADVDETNLHSLVCTKHTSTCIHIC